MTDPPSADDYVRAVQDARNLLPSCLQTSTFPPHPLLGVPIPASGSSAVVFRAVVNGKDEAIRFFTRYDPTSRDRYAVLDAYVGLWPIRPHLPATTWLDDAVCVNGSTWPALRMEWLPGRTLDQYVEQLVEDRDSSALCGLGTAWRELLRTMQKSGFAHGDLQHGNVLVDEVGTLRLVDLDSCWTAELRGDLAPSESGHRNYQRRDAQWGRWMDTVPGLVIYTSLLALARQPELWGRFHNGENLLFTDGDLVPDAQTPVWDDLARIQDRELVTATAALRRTCAAGQCPESTVDALLVPRWWENVRREEPAPPPSTRYIVVADGTDTRSRSLVPMLVSAVSEAVRTWRASPRQTVMPTGSQNRGDPWTVLRSIYPRNLTLWAFAFALIVAIFLAGLTEEETDDQEFHTPYATIWTKFALPERSLGDCTNLEVSSAGLTQYDVEAVACAGRKSPYAYKFYKYDGASKQEWVNAAESKYSLTAWGPGDCFATYSGVHERHKFALFVYEGAPFVLEISAAPGVSITDQQLTLLRFPFMSQGCQ